MQEHSPSQLDWRSYRYLNASFWFFIVAVLEPFFMKNGVLPLGPLTYSILVVSCAAAVMNTNPRFIFFTENPGQGAVGAQGIRLTPERSLAVDLDFMPLHAPMWLETSATAPNGSTRSIHRMMVAQDTGSAINGVVRGDYFWGSGEGALAMAGRMKSQGVYTILLPNGLAATLAPD